MMIGDYGNKNFDAFIENDDYQQCWWVSNWDSQQWIAPQVKKGILKWICLKEGPTLVQCGQNWFPQLNLMRMIYLNLFHNIPTVRMSTMEVKMRENVARESSSAKWLVFPPRPGGSQGGGRHESENLVSVIVGCGCIALHRRAPPGSIPPPPTD